MTLPRIVLAASLAAMLTGGVVFVAGCAESPAASTPPARTFDAALVARGAGLAELGACFGCHTAPGGKPYAGGRALQTPFGTIYGTNITPDAATGIGNWSEDAFVRAMREGVDRDGRQLYPAFPYNHFRRVPMEDLQALYAFVMTREPVAARPPPNRLQFPFNVRPFIAGWKALYLQRGAAPRVSGDPAVERGAALVEGLGHCGACHSPRNAMGAEEDARALAGGDAEGWHAPALTTASPAPLRWTADELYVYLRGGVPARHGVAVGPMAPVATHLMDAPQADVRAIAAYLAALGGTAPPADVPERATSVATSSAHQPVGDTEAAAIYAGACALCHDHGRQGPFSGAVPLSQSSAVAAPTPRNFAQIVLHGLAPRDGETGASMPGYAGALTEAQVVDLASYVRARFGGRAPWPDAAQVISDVIRHPDG